MKSVGGKPKNSYKSHLKESLETYCVTIIGLFKFSKK